MAEWIWYPGEFEHRTSNVFHVDRFIREHRFMPLWKMSSIEPYVVFYKNILLTKPEDFIVATEGLCDVRIDGKSDIGGNNNWPQFINGKYHLDAGEYRLSVHVVNNDGKIPCCYIEGDSIQSDKSWKCLLKGEKPIDVGHDGFNNKDISPNQFKLSIRRENYIKKEEHNDFTLYDFGREVLGYIVLTDINKKGKVNLYYGESIEEVLDFNYCELIDTIETDKGKTTIDVKRAFRYVALQKINGAKYSDIYLNYEYKPFSKRADVKFSDKKMQNIWDTSMYTLELCNREFFIDGVKRDRWYWAADANISYLMNWYSFFDEKTVKRTQIALSGKGKLYRHLSTIPSFTLYWLIAFYEIYEYTKDIEFINKWSKRFFEIMEFVLSRCDKNFRLQVQKNDWNFFDWGDDLEINADSFSILQILLFRCTKAAEKVARLIEDNDKSKFYSDIADCVFKDLHKNYWCKKAGAFDFGIKDGNPTGIFLRQPNVLAAFYEVANKTQRESIIKNVLLNKDISKLRTPFMKFFELSVLSEGDMVDVVLQNIRDYWGGMLDLGATTFWETYNPEDKGQQHYAMYNRKYGKSLCHAWSSSPIYIICRHYFGLRPLKDGYDSYLLKPKAKLLGDFKAVLPIKNGELEIEQKGNALSVYSSSSEGVLDFNGTKSIVPINKKITVYY